MAVSASTNVLASKSTVPREASGKHFHIFGHGISFSRSPAIHNSGFRYYELPHTYDIRETEGVDELASLINDADFGGASVTMPHKLKVHKYCALQTEHAINIGAINTLIVKNPDNIHGNRQIVGENTDWMGLYQLILKYAHIDRKVDLGPGLVIGAGGASRAALYAMHQAGISKIYLANRTIAHAVKIANDLSAIFEVIVVTSIAELPEAPEIIIGTIPADKTTTSMFDGLCSRPRGQCIDMAYKPRLTPLLQVAGRNSGWTIVPGIEVLLHQAYEQFKIWTDLDAPRETMVAAIEHEDQVSNASQGI